MIGANCSFKYFSLLIIQNEKIFSSKLRKITFELQSHQSQSEQFKIFQIYQCIGNENARDICWYCMCEIKQLHILSQKFSFWQHYLSSTLSRQMSLVSYQKREAYTEPLSAHIAFSVWRIKKSALTLMTFLIKKISEYCTN